MELNMQPLKPQNPVTALASAEQSRAIQEVQAALVIAKSFPRDEKQAIDEIMNACQNTRLAEQAVYQYARGGQNIEGPSIRLAETISQYWGNVQSGWRVVAVHTGDDGIAVSQVEVFAWDQQRNARKVLQFQVRHWRDTKAGGKALTDERDVYELIANMAQRRLRACILAVIPGHVVDMALNQCQETLSADADTSPDAQKKILAAFAKEGVTQEQLEKKLQRRIDAITPAQVVSLRKILVSLRDGIGKASDFFDVANSATAPVIEVVASPVAAKKPAKKAASSEQSEKEKAFWQRSGDMGLTVDEVSAYLKDHNLTPDTITAEQQEDMETVLLG